MKLKTFSRDRKGFIYKTLFFVSLLIILAFTYFESKALIDVVYFIVVLAIFIRFLILKLYHLWYNFFGDINVNRYTLSCFIKWIW